ncbi:ABC transporter ATP-binding protein/permease [Aetokthonos hydrillicola Thurmond2011]|jgi:putative ATP-binding cassette transporter|uniref:ABC transporter ATP-binding protein/permease n=1 Tax=Aetokthonos hydrillicola Thurmond2011 TaxID=2712845 RepID=A0AAP5I9T4_9CYAN|nr:ABC transporter ATP-binding protein/permease [Aetokthonos hydrillicola]MBO3460257.1 ABC transporter ATP-binding protein/permease [Aetokthonos hydrillicola CCALA 1050]MBW4586990.1 ABC transporter ATP-binding protein/permease [Aetokthonos hydrillicola CCALA 1050]MDR9897535.1 ABC transporter ATP-binding protein/permease [Aetokthonos hydrillicola Thurmond2011]
MDRFNLKLIRRFWAIAKPYWFGSEKWSSGGLLLLCVLLLLAYTGLAVVLNAQQGALISALSAKDESRFGKSIQVFIGVLVLYAPLLAGYDYLQDRLGLSWRRWLTNNFLDNYFSNRAFYNLNSSNTEIDNPDQRIAEDVKSFTQDSLRFLLTFVGSILKVIAFSGVLWGISKPLVIFLVIYALSGTILTTGVFGKPLIRLNFEQLRKEANFRFGLIHIRENAESIAFYRGEQQESNHLKNRFMEAFDNFKQLIFWELNLNVLTNAYEFIPFIIPALVISHNVFAGEIEVGKISEAQGAFVRVFFSLNVIVSRLQSLASFGAGIDRLYSFAEYLEPKAPALPGFFLTQENQKQDETPTIDIVEESRFAIKDLNLQTPNYQRTLIKDLSVELSSGQGLLIRGPSGCGKSSLLRAIAGLWNAGTGVIVRPKLNEMLFLPQRPYMILGTLRDQLLYPYTNVELDDSVLKQVLQQVNLKDLDERYGGFDVEQDWASLLSLGEQQRLTFARLLLNKPAYAILDEATSALDLKNEESLYQHLQQSSTTFISVGHRPNLVDYHQLVLELSEDQNWLLQQPEVAVR